jgi:DNA-directed RNA polymerase specialized sigma24 family protein
MGRIPFESRSAGAREVFPETQWSLVHLAANRGNQDEQRKALATLLQRYGPALRAHLAARKLRADAIDDLLQGFIADKIIALKLLERARRERGKFRSFLLVTLNNYVASHHRGQRMKKRQPLGEVVVLREEEDLLAPDADSDPTDAYALAWARELLGEALRRTRQECDASKREDLWLIFETRVVRPALDGAAPLPYDQLVCRLGLSAPIEACNLLSTAKRMFARNLRAVAAEYADPDTGPDAELDDLRTIVSQAGCAESHTARRSPW